VDCVQPSGKVVIVKLFLLLDRLIGIWYFSLHLLLSFLIWFVCLMEPATEVVIVKILLFLVHSILLDIVFDIKITAIY